MRRGSSQATIDRSPIRTFYTVGGFYKLYDNNFASQGKTKCDVCCQEEWSGTFYHKEKFNCCNSHAISAENILASGATWQDALQLSLCNGILMEISKCMKAE